MSYEFHTNVRLLKQGTDDEDAATRKYVDDAITGGGGGGGNGGTASWEATELKDEAGLDFNTILKPGSYVGGFGIHQIANSPNHLFNQTDGFVNDFVLVVQGTESAMEDRPQLGGGKMRIVMQAIGWQPRTPEAGQVVVCMRMGHGLVQDPPNFSDWVLAAGGTGPPAPAGVRTTFIDTVEPLAALEGDFWFALRN